MENYFESLVSFFNSSDFDLLLNSLVFLLVALHLSIAIWVARDSAARSNSVIFQIFAVTLAIFLPIFGLVFYLILRPSLPFVEKIIDNFTMFASMNSCVFCGGYVKDEYKYCPHCSKKLYRKCTGKTCGKRYPYAFESCPFCNRKSGATQE